MKTLFLKKLQDNSRYGMIYSNFVEKECQLYLMVDILNSSYIYEHLKNKKSIFIHSSFNEICIDEGSENDDYYVAFVDQLLFKKYEKIAGGRFIVNEEKLPKLKISKENFDVLAMRIIQVHEQKPEYLIILQSQDGWIDILSKELLSIQEKQLVDNYNKYLREYR